MTVLKVKLRAQRQIIGRWKYGFSMFPMKISRATYHYLCSNFNIASLGKKFFKSSYDVNVKIHM